MIIKTHFYHPVKLLLILLITVTLVACGGGSSSDSRSSVEETQSPEEKTPQPVEETQPPEENTAQPVEETHPPEESTAQPVEEAATCPTIHPHEDYMAIGDSLTGGTGDDISSDNVTSDGCFNSKGFPPVLIDKLNNIKGKKHVVWNKGVSGATSQDGSGSVGHLLSVRESMHYLVMYGTNDSTDAYLDRGVTKQQFKKNMQDIIDQIHSAGKNAYLAKLPPTLGDFTHGGEYPNLDQGPRNKLIQQYNQAIDELVHENNISIKPPDFYGYFKSHPEEYSDNLHLNGVGYDSMADLWLQSLRHL